LNLEVPHHLPDVANFDLGTPCLTRAPVSAQRKAWKGRVAWSRNCPQVVTVLARLVAGQAVIEHLPDDSKLNRL